MLAPSRWRLISVVAALIFGVLFTLPNLLPASVREALPAFLPKQTLNLGLDLQGGSYLKLSVDTRALRAEKTTNLIEDVRTTLRSEDIAFTDLGQVGSDVTVRITDPARSNEALNLLRTRLGGDIASGGSGLELSAQADQRIRMGYSAQALNAEASRAVDQSIEIIRRRIDALGTREPAIQRQGFDQIVVQAPGESDPERLKSIIGQTAKLTFQMVDDSVSVEEALQGRVPPGSVVLPSQDEGPLLLKKRAVVTGEMLTEASQGFDGQTGQPVVNFRFNGQGAARFGEVTASSIGKRFAIVLDGKIISAPVIQSAIMGRSGQISGNFTAESANDLAVLLRAGALPAPLRVEQQNTVGAELGADAVRAGAISMAIGAAAMFAFIVLAYGVFGVFAALALALNVLLIVGAMSMTQATLTFPGIAGIILTLAVAVDANVLIYERVRDEAHLGRSPLQALEHGYERALVSIFDANITSAISAIIMFMFGAGAVRGFAWTLLIGVVTSVFTAVVVTQLLIGWWFRAKKPKTLPIV
jgi:preprotein translocase subunit SecD